MSETPDQNERRHAEAPAEGEEEGGTSSPDAPSGERVHAQEPAEGAASEAGPADADGPGTPDPAGGAPSS